MKIKSLTCTFIVMFVFSLFITFGCKSDEGGARGKQDLPNIIYILADDLGYGDLSSYGQELFKTPSIDALANSGMRFTQHYAGSTVCAPSRAVLMTGLHTGHVSIRGNKEMRPEGQYPLLEESETIPEMLKGKGYVTGAFGKWGLGFPGSEGDPNNQGFDEFYGYNCQRLAHHYYPRYLWHNADTVKLPENYGQGKGTYAPQLIHEQSLAFIEEHKEEPFFMFVPHVIPHAELAAPESIVEKYRGKFLPEKSYEGTDDGVNYRQGPYESQEESHATFVAMIDLLDQHVGEIVSKVEDLGLSKNTLIIFSSDNGPHIEGGADPAYFKSSGPFLGIKRNLKEGGIRVPMIASWKGRIGEGKVSDHISSFQDVKATFADLAGVEERSKDDGISFLPSLFEEGEQREHEYLYWEFPALGQKIAIRYGRWKAVSKNLMAGSTFALYDLEASLQEKVDVSADHPEVMEKIRFFADQAHIRNDQFVLEIDKSN